MGLKDYTTEVPASQSISEIEGILIKHSATDIWKQFDSTGSITSLNFAVITDYGKIPFKLAINIEAVRQILIEQKESGEAKKISKRRVESIEHARNVGWRILKHWIDAQMALVEVKMRKLEQVFLADVWDMHTGKTLYEGLAEKKFTGMLMEGKT